MHIIQSVRARLKNTYIGIKKNTQLLIRVPRQFRDLPRHKGAGENDKRDDEELSEDRLGVHVAITYGGYRDEDEVETLVEWNTLDLGKYDMGEAKRDTHIYIYIYRERER
jgi:hypothetical protein